MKLGAVYVKKVEEDWQEITDGTHHIHSWIREGFIRFSSVTF